MSIRQEETPSLSSGGRGRLLGRNNRLAAMGLGYTEALSSVELPNRLSILFLSFSRAFA